MARRTRRRAPVSAGERQEGDLVMQSQGQRKSRQDRGEKVADLGFQKDKLGRRPDVYLQARCLLTLLIVISG
jgi:hypothetical protein